MDLNTKYYIPVGPLSPQYKQSWYCPTSILSRSVTRYWRTKHESVSPSFIWKFLIGIRISYSLLLSQKLIIILPSSCCPWPTLSLSSLQPRGQIIKGLSYKGDSKSLQEQTNCFHGRTWNTSFVDHNQRRNYKLFSEKKRQTLSCHNCHPIETWVATTWSSRKSSRLKAKMLVLPPTGQMTLPTLLISQTTVFY